MNHVSKIALLSVASAALLLGGCSKKPRPAPSDTALGSQNSVTPPTAVDVAPGTNLEVRGDGFDMNGQNRLALQGQTVYFDFDQSAIKASEREKLKAAKEYLDKNPSHRIVLEGHCDWRGTAEYNLGLGDRRAAAVKKYLTSIGVSADKLETVSKGSLEAAKNADAATMAKDRRVDLVVVQQKAPGAL
jgi:peptidoglycan-associated lipoprotein